MNGAIRYHGFLTCSGGLLMDAHTTLDADRLERLRAAVGAERVDAMLEAARQAGDSYLPGDQDPVFGFIQRALIQLKNSGRNCGLIFPKQDPEFRRFVDYFDGEGRIIVIRPGDEPGGMHIEPGWVRPAEQSHPDCPFFEVAPGMAEAIMAAFLEAYAAMRARAET
jgi:hypothetical protein